MTYSNWRERLFEALDPRFYTQEWLDAEVAANRVLFLCNDVAACLFKFERYPTGHMEIQALAGAGDLHVMARELVPMCERIGKSLGCETGRITSRGGWIKLLEKAGYSVYQTALEKVL